MIYRYLLTAASFVVIVAGMRAAQSLLVPFLLAVFIAVILSPPLRWMRRKGVPTSVALLLIVALVAVAGAGLAGVVGKSVNDFSRNYPTYQKAWVQQTQRLQTWLADHGIEFPDQNRDTSPQNGGIFSLEPQSAMRLVQRILAELAARLSNAFIILITVIFMLFEASRLPDKLQAAVGQNSPAVAHAEVIVANVRRYVVIKTLTSLLTGILVAIFLTVLGIDYPLLWALFAFLFNYVPNIGSIIAAVPAVILALVQSGLPLTVGVAAGYVVINCVVSYAIEPRFTGQGLGLSTLVVFLSLIFWGWVLGPVGMLLSAPLTMIVKIVLQDYDETRWLAVMMASKAPLARA